MLEAVQVVLQMSSTVSLKGVGQQVLPISYNASAGVVVFCSGRKFKHVWDIVSDYGITRSLRFRPELNKVRIVFIYSSKSYWFGYVLQI